NLSAGVTFAPGNSIAVATYTYTVTSSDCGTDETEIRLRIHKAPYAGENTTIQVCSTEPTFNIRDRFNTLAGLTVSNQGTFSLVSSTSGISYNAGVWNANGKFVPGDQGTYPETDTICIQFQASNPIGCPEDVSTICIEFQLEPFAGVSLTRTVCESDGVGNTINLHSVIGTPANQRPGKSNGIWSETSTNDAGLDISNGDLDLSVAIDTHFGGNTGTFVYEYLIAGFGQCSDSKATLTLTIEKEVGPGNTADYFFCDNDVNPKMTDVVGAPDGGTWSGSGVNKMSTPLDFGSTFDVQSSGQVDGLPGYNIKYTIDNVACNDVDFGARVKVFIAPEAGADNVDEVELCKGAIDVDLMEFRKGTYDVEGTSIKVEFFDETNNRTINLSTGEAIIDFTPSSGNNSYSPGLHNFYHIVKRVVPGSPGIVVCEDSALIQINVLELPNAGGNGKFTLLSSDTPIDLSTYVAGNNPIGDFENLSGGGIVPPNMFDPSQAAKFANVIIHVSKNGIDNDGCRDTSLVMGYVLQEMDPGGDGEIVACETEKIDLFSGLTGNPEKQNLAITDGYTYINQGWRFGMSPSDMVTWVDLKNLFNSNTNINSVVNNDPLGYGPFYTVTPPAQVSSELDVTKFINALAEAAPAPVVFVGGQSVGTVEDRLDVPRYFQVDYRFEYVMAYDVPSLFSLRDTEFNDQKNNNNFQFWGNITNLTSANLGFDVSGFDTEKKASTLLEVSRNFKDLVEFNPDNPLLRLCAGEIQIDLNKWFRGKGNVVLPNGFKVYDYVVKQHKLDRDSMAFFLNGAANSPNITFASGNVFLSTVGLAAGKHKLTATIVTSDGEKPCQEVEIDEIEFEIFEKPNAGLDAELDLCIEDNLQIFTELKNLDNTIDEDGVVGRYFGNGGNNWDDDDVSVLSGYTFIATPNTNTSAPIIAGPYDVYYSVQSEFGCYINNNRGNALVSDTAVVRINVVGKPKLGSPALDGNGEILVCENYTFDPIVFLPGAEQGGIWTDVTATGSLSTSVQGNVSFVTEISTLDNVTLTYGHDNGICPAEEISYDIRIIRDPNAGDETSAIICGSAVSEDLFALIDGSPDIAPQGVWSGDIAQQFFSGNLLNAAAVGSGVYDVTYTIFSEECRGFDEESGQLFVGGGAVLKDEVTIELEIERVPEAGTTNPDIEKVCGSNNAVNLLSKLNGFPDNTGYWTTSADPSSSFINGQFFDATSFIGETLTFVYTVGGVACPEDKATIQKLVIVPPADGKGTREASLCYVEDQINLYTSFGYNTNGGNWFRISSGGVQIPISNSDASFFDPRSLGVGQSKLMFIATGAFPCKNDTGIINVTVAPAPKAGMDTTISVCTGVLLQDLTAFLAGNNKIGTFYTADQTLINGVNFDVQTAGAGMTEGDVKTYDIFHEAKTSPCEADSAKITFNLYPRPQAGGNVTADVCTGLGTLNLLDIVGPNAFVGGKFSTLNQTILVEDALDANELDLTLLPEGTYTVYYKVSLPQTAINPIGCNFDEAKLTINVLPLGEQDVFICSDKQAIDLYDYLLADVTGTWVDGSGGSELNGSLFNALAAGPGNRVFTLTDADVYCPSGIILNASIVDPIQLDSKGVVVSCEAGDPTYRITFTVIGGQLGTYSVAQGPSNGTYNASTGTFTFVIDANDPYNIIIEDGISCNPLPVIGYPDCTDFDGDGIVNAIDKDDDNDGVPDTAESFGFDALADHDGDQVPNAEDGDFCAANGGVINGQGKCSIFDLDGDGMINQLEVDSDNDGIFDLYEVFFGQAIANDMNGILEGASLTGMVDGWSDLASNFFVANSSVADDTDGDNLPDFLDVDSDNDGISDEVESSGFPVVDTDGDDTDDYRDLDSDDDSIEDVFEGAGDTDGDGITDFRDEDADGDGIMDVQERITASGLAPEDIDGDGKYNFQDLDSDGDLIPDEVEKDGEELGVLANTDGDAFEDFRDIDSDNDGISDKIEAAGEPNRPVDSDNDGVPDYRSLDSDSDGTSDTEEALDLLNPFDTDEDGIADYREVDSDDDGISDEVERQLDRGDLIDSDGIPDYRDVDSDGDGISDKDEAFFDADLETPTDLSDFDGNGVFNHQDLDSDGDNISDNMENGTEAIQLGRPADADNDGFKNFVDRDSDNDGVPDHIEGELDCDGDGVPAYLDYGDNCQIKIANIPEGISPNGDGVNDFWIVPNIADFPGCKVQVFNRWGSLVYEMTDYDSSWGGTTSKGIVGDDILPSGTYYYLIDLNLGQDPLKGFIYISSDK
ncbi:MAG: gliding motility-associated-like protein, partial [Sphingobacteriales bacterium]